MGLNPVAEILKRADKVLRSAEGALADVEVTLGDVDTKLGGVETTLAETRRVLGELNDRLVLLDRLPELDAKLDAVLAALGESRGG